jgi:hypothetical protein
MNGFPGNRRSHKPHLGSQLDLANPLTSGLVLNVLYNECGGTPCNQANGSAAAVTLPGNLAWGSTATGPARNSTVKGGAQFETYTPAVPISWVGPFSVEVWCLMRSFQAGSGISGLFYGNGGGANNCIVRFNGTNGRQAEFLSGSVTLDSPAQLGPNVMLHLVATSGGSGGPLRLYANGALVASGTAGTYSGTAVSTVMLFRDDTTARAPDGLISRAKVWNRVIGAGDVLSLYNAPDQLWLPSSVRRFMALVGTTVFIMPAGIPSAEAWGAPACSATATVAPAGIASGEAWGAPALAATAIVAPAGIPSGEAWGQVIVAAGSGSSVPTQLLAAAQPLPGFPDAAWSAVAVASGTPDAAWSAVSPL